MATYQSKKDSGSGTTSTADSHLNCVIASGTNIEGDFNTSENVRIDGSIKGNIKCDKKLVLGRAAKIEGKLEAQEAVIMGNVKGDLKISGLIKLEATAVINGDITAKKFMVDEGAKFNGISKIG